MGWFRTFATVGVYYDTFAIGFGSLCLLIAKHRQDVLPEEVERTHPALRWLLCHPWERWSGWTMIVSGIVGITFKLTR